MNPDVFRLIPLIIAQVKRRGGAVTKTKLLKLLYLFDVSYYRKYRETFTGFNWVYLHFGPWVNEYDSVLLKLEDEHVINRTAHNDARYDMEFLSTNLDLDGADEFLKGQAYLSLNGVLNNWSTLTLGPILNYVYFRTEPMANGTRYKPLDFSTISPDPPIQYKRPVSNTPPKKLAEYRKKAAAILAEAKNVPQNPETVKYDDLFYQGMEALDRLD